MKVKGWIAGLLLLLPTAAFAQLFNGSNWAVSGSIGGSSIPAIESKGISSGNNFNHSIMVEHIFDNSMFSIRGGYEKEELYTTDGISQTFDLRGLKIGANAYPMHKLTHTPIQLYGGLDLGYCYSSDNNSQVITDNSRWENRLTNQTFSLTPHIGADLFLFSSIALTLEYGYRIAPGSKIEQTYISGAANHGYSVNANRHLLTLGLKVTFPFRFSTADGANLFMLIFTNLFDKHYYYY